MVPIHVKDLKDADEDITKYSYKNFKNLIEIKNFLILYKKGVRHGKYWGA